MKCAATKSESKSDSHLNKSRRLSKILLSISFVLFLTMHSLASPRSNFSFGEDRKWTSVTFLAGASVISGERSGIGANSFSTISSADGLYKSPRHFAFEFAEHSNRTTLAFGIEFTKISVAEALRTELGLIDSSALTVSYIDAPLTYRVSSHPGGKSALNLSIGVSLITMLDVAKSTESVFESGADATSKSTVALDGKHIDFGFGIGGEIGIEKRVSTNVFLTASAGIRRPFTGVTRPDFSFLLTGIRIYQR